MAEIQQTGPKGSHPTIDEPRSGRAKLDQLKARLFPPETKPQRVARALEALQRATRISKLEPAMLKYLAQHADLEGD